MNILKEIIDLGIIVEDEAAEIINSLEAAEQKKLLEELEIEKPVVLKKDFLKKKYSIQGFVDIYNTYYEIFKNILLNRTELNNLVSINNCKTGKVSVIGLVKTINRNDKKIELEDPTGSIHIVLNEKLKEEAEKLIEDEVIVVSGGINNKTLFADKILFPDIGLKQAKTTKKKHIIFFSFKKQQTKADKIISLEEIEKQELEIENVRILVLNNQKQGNPLELLKKRHLEPGNVFKQDLIIKEVPDIFLTSSEKPEIINYKGTTIISINEKTSAKIDLQTRKAELITS